MAALTLNPRPLAHTGTETAAGGRDAKRCPFFQERLGSGTVHLVVFPGSFGAADVFLLIRQKTEQHARSCFEDGLTSPAGNERPRFLVFCFPTFFSLKNRARVYLSLQIKRTESTEGKNFY